MTRWNLVPSYLASTRLMKLATVFGASCFRKSSRTMDPLLVLSRTRGRSSAWPSFARKRLFFFQNPAYSSHVFTNPFARRRSGVGVGARFGLRSRAFSNNHSNRNAPYCRESTVADLHLWLHKLVGNESHVGETVFFEQLPRISSMTSSAFGVSPDLISLFRMATTSEYFCASANLITTGRGDGVGGIL